ncbi:hypothetical protein PVW48_17445 [Dinoroseobacter sp. PD6]|uniref:aspartate/glutamate racemase family protein n=1 Tax=Dinoroseobacter sp. PD6 TaxID=3028384 RepID=UPI00237B2FB3|nr:aspartate/glutamate racemase family protein [Dinoroseobacter sp. PD6]MDD9718551.1 hypothetical protein [Dinoroseobacter sp. PD6]
MPRIALIHATRVAIDPIEEAARKLWPDAEMISILEEGLSVDRPKSKDLSAGLHHRIVGLTRYAESTDADGILFTCSAFGNAIQDAARSSPVPVMKPNEAMFDAALELGERIAMIYTFPPAAAGMEEEFREAAHEKGRTADLRSYFCDGALDALRAGNNAEHNRLVALTAQGIEDVDAIMLAQFSMAEAADEVRRHIDIPILTSPEAAITEIRRRVETSERNKTC